MMNVVLKKRDRFHITYLRPIGWSLAHTWDQMMVRVPVSGSKGRMLNLRAGSVIQVKRLCAFVWCLVLLFVGLAGNTDRKVTSSDKQDLFFVTYQRRSSLKGGATYAKSKGDVE
jgi:hypothetical protein